VPSHDSKTNIWLGNAFGLRIRKGHAKDNSCDVYKDRIRARNAIGSLYFMCIISTFLSFFKLVFWKRYYNIDFYFFFKQSFAKKVIKKIQQNIWWNTPSFSADEINEFWQNLWYDVAMFFMNECMYVLLDNKWNFIFILYVLSVAMNVNSFITSSLSFCAAKNKSNKIKNNTDYCTTSAINTTW